MSGYVESEAVALAVGEVLEVLEQQRLESATVGAPYVDGTPGERAWRCTVKINAHVLSPRFATLEDASAYRAAVSEALDRAA